MHSSHIVHNVGKAAEQCNDHAFGKLYISLTEADILPVGEEKNEYQLQLKNTVHADFSNKHALIKKNKRKNKKKSETEC